MTQPIPIVSETFNADTAATPNTAALRDSSGDLTVAALIASALISSGPRQTAVGTRSASFTLGANEIENCNCTAGAIAVTCPLASANVGFVGIIVKTDSSSNHVTFSGVSGIASLTTQWTAALVYTDGTSWFVIQL